MNAIRNVPFNPHSRVQWNPAYTGQDAQQGSTPILVLVHEITHAWSDRWSPGIGTPSSTGLILNEVYAVRGANQIGKEIGVPGLRPRTRYGNKQVPDPEQAMFPQCSAQTCAQWYEELDNGGWGNFGKTGRD